MSLETVNKPKLFKKYGSSDKDSGSSSSQVALYTSRINHLTEHLKQNNKDMNTKLALTKLVGRRRRLLDYMVKHDLTGYRSIIKELKIRK